MSKTYSLLYLPSSKQFIRYCGLRAGYLQYKEFRIDLKTGQRINTSVRSLLQECEDFQPLKEESQTPKVMHFFYEFGYLTQGLGHLVSETTLLAIILDYESYHTVPCLFQVDEKNFVELELLEFPNKENYRQQFQRCQKHLRDGDCYQLNLTAPFYFRLPKTLSRHDEFLNHVWSRPEQISAYAHCSYIDEINKMYFSNSPECLFGMNSSHIYSMPIKGTAKLDSVNNKERVWKELSSSMKNQAELYMITDLIRNDLTKIELIPAKVLAKKLALHVPGILHQYSIVSAGVTSNLNLAQLLTALFPGGSITGAPKKRVMELLYHLESEARGFYCGSTLVFHKSLMAGSINIRSSEIDFTAQELKYCAGGAITLESECEDEYEELCAKMKSFLLLFRKQNLRN